VIVDLSVGGVFIEAASSPPFGAPVMIHADLPGAPRLALSAVVRWTKPQGFGVQFGLLGAVETHALAAIVAKSRLSA
jgi:type IV pilus assembly protein PilZ